MKARLILALTALLGIGLAAMAQAQDPLCNWLGDAEVRVYPRHIDVVNDARGIVLETPNENEGRDYCEPNLPCIQLTLETTTRRGYQYNLAWELRGTPGQHDIERIKGGDNGRWHPLKLKQEDFKDGQFVLSPRAMMADQTGEWRACVREPLVITLRTPENQSRLLRPTFVQQRFCDPNCKNPPQIVLGGSLAGGLSRDLLRGGPQLWTGALPLTQLAAPEAQ
ncbi:hypothetical protein [uncultured Thiocystis sp.]|jgi:hypothetical protein|uniref:hypothetical protein n=1 Tax=uncultured Thiocystis sp. TaxID=1202134 RepID=UPI0025CD53AC|nr:hypothetical protein [uncultured Thiocystis sp.]